MALAKEKPANAAATRLVEDAYAWCFEQADLLRQKRFPEIDVQGLIEELESMGSEKRHALRSSYRLIISHLLKWHFQTERRARSWELTIARERINVADREGDSKTLKNDAPAIVDEAYRSAVFLAAKETGLARAAFPADCPYTIDELRDPDWMPE